MTVRELKIWRSTAWLMRSAISTISCCDKVETVLLPVQYHSTPSTPVSNAISITNGSTSDKVSDEALRVGM